MANNKTSKNSSGEIRLQKYFTDLGIMSRRAAEAVIAEGRVKVNGKVAEIGQKIVPGRDKVVYNSKVLGAEEPERKLYIMLNKPRAVITSLSDECGRRCIKDLISDIPGRVYPVGRLDYNSDGLLLLTNDGEFTNAMTHPRHGISKIYLVKVSGRVNAAQIEKLNKPMNIDGYDLLPVEAEITDPGETSTVIQMTLREGRNRQIRKMCEKVGLNVLRLKRVAIGKVELGDLPAGKWRELTPKEVDYLIKESKRATEEK